MDAIDESVAFVAFVNTLGCDSSNRPASDVSGVKNEELIATDSSTRSSRFDNVELPGSVENEVDAIDEYVAFDNRPPRTEKGATIDASPVMSIERYSLLFD